ncbi:DUF3617 domain-containing protein [Dyella ginsengisoli]|uniref:DUF3617 domain-containing protein n=1 Tax=Dyella ginsengisoli TaxID=363848 RepID=UPI00036A86A5|nr:DUF3617 family protein [Dyella ginsengisoli]
MFSRRVLCACAVLVLSVPSCVLAASQGRLMKLTTTTTLHMQGMAMPPRVMSREVCTAPAGFDPRQLVSTRNGSDCKVSDYRQRGHTITFHVACTRPQKVSSDGTFHQLADSGFDGEMRTTTAVAGHDATLDTRYVGQHVGDCSYTPPTH